jgi:hypothetical protein
MLVRYSLELAETVKASSSPDIMSTTKKQTNQEEILHKKSFAMLGTRIARSLEHKEN